MIDTKATQIRQRLARAIIDGELLPDDRLVLDELAREMGVSKIPIREALSSLEGAGLVVTSAHSGPRVAPLPFHEIRGIYLLREQVESLAMRLAIEHVDEQMIDELREINGAMRRGLASPDVVELSDLNTKFHLTIARTSSFETIVESVGDLLTKVRRYRAVVNGMAANWPRAVEEHDGIIQALVDTLAGAGPDAAVESIRNHVHTQGMLEALEATERADA
ncbi:GntR family transcriptional regulator [Agromyces aureus]|nr:GntR family transcriptional regulator [Agromyces aureus]